MPRPKLAARAPSLELVAALSAVALLSGSCAEDVGLVPPEAERAAPTEAAAEVATGRAKFGDHVVSGPYTHANLAVYLVHGEDKIRGRSFLTLEEALARKLAVFHETGNVSELAIENVSLTEEIYVQSGDIVKGGKQDRVIAHDFIVPAKSGKMPIASFCVERGRWSQRGRESVVHFSASSDQLSTKALKLAAKHKGGQRIVWREVDKAQTLLSGSYATIDEYRVVVEAFDARAQESPTSLQLTLEMKEIRETADKYIKALSGINDEHDDVVGFAFAINGEANSADIYASRALFRKLWPKLLKAAAVEAIAELKKDEKNEKVAHPSAGKLVAEFFTKLDKEGEKVTVSEKEITKRVRMKTKESADIVRFDTYDQTILRMKYGRAAPAEAKHVPVHTNLIKK